MDEDDPYVFLIGLCEIPSKQEDLLLRCPIVGDKANSHLDEPRPTSDGMLEASAGIVISSLTETESDGKENSGSEDIFHTPPQMSSLPTSDDQPKSPAVYHCTVNKTVEFGEETMDFVDFAGADTESWFSEVVAECSRRTDGAAVSQTYDCELNKVPVLERELSLKDGLASREFSMEVTIEANACGESSAEKSLGSGENLGTQVVEPEIVRSEGNFTFHGGGVEACVGNGENSEPPHTGEINETSERQNRTRERPRERVPPSIFDVLNVVGGDSEEDSLENVSLVKIAKNRGMTFPSPRWWPKNSGHK
ncbi:hypothetical protein L6164_019715 [Bauhinia variegata]|uniref:Uncharacterized protein n=1 Tax=Bauhinia variegata TaxID=167791 RepID=A0ACB9MUB4_BAUVA|nr:hypothetical protein L6164_019715 [Bauhinia variegata]